MQPRPTKLTIRVKGGIHEVVNSTARSHQDSIKQEPSDLDCPNVPPNPDDKRPDHDNGSTFHVDLNNESQNVIDISSSECSSDDEDIPSCDDSQKQLVLYDPSMNGADEIEAAPDPIAYKPPSFSRHPFEYHTQRELPSVGAFTVQCANCFKWRLIPSQEKYEEIREHITEQPFVCETAREWRPDISCDDPPDIEQDGSRLWAIDKPNIAQPPPGWHRLLRIRGEGGTKFADVYYTAPTGTKLRSLPDVEKYLMKHPEFVEQGVTISQFSFQIPRPLQENYVRKRPARTTALHDGGYPGMPVSLEPPPANRIAWTNSDQNTDLQLGLPGWSAPYPSFDPRPVKKARSAPSKQRCNFDLVYKHHQI